MDGFRSRIKIPTKISHPPHILDVLIKKTLGPNIKHGPSQYLTRKFTTELPINLEMIFSQQ